VKSHISAGVPGFEEDMALTSVLTFHRRVSGDPDHPTERGHKSMPHLSGVEAETERGHRSMPHLSSMAEGEAGGVEDRGRCDQQTF